MKAAFRADASLTIGTGHIMRCLTLADALEARGASCHFFCRDHSGNLAGLISQRGHHVHLLAAPPESADALLGRAEHGNTRSPYAQWLGVSDAVDAKQTRSALDKLQPDWLVADHYALDADWERIATPDGCRLLVIDDLADRPHLADVLLDQNLGKTAEDYRDLIPPHCKVLVGPRYALLRPEFVEHRQSSLRRRNRPRLKRILISLGGVDKDNVTGRVLSALSDCALPSEVEIVAVMGAGAPWIENVKQQAEQMAWPTAVRVNITNMAQYMADADLAIGAGGSTSWERCCLGLPTLMIVLAENQLPTARALAAAGASILLGGPEDISAELPTHVERCLVPESLRRMIEASSRVTDGAGASRVLQFMDVHTKESDNV